MAVFLIVSLVFNKNHVIVSSVYILLHTWGDQKFPELLKQLFKVETAFYNRLSKER